MDPVSRITLNVEFVYIIADCRELYGLITVVLSKHGWSSIGIPAWLNDDRPWQTV